MKILILSLVILFTFNSMAQQTHRYDCRMFGAEFQTYDLQLFQNIQIPLITFKGKLEKLNAM